MKQSGNLLQLHNSNLHWILFFTFFFSYSCSTPEPVIIERDENPDPLICFSEKTEFFVINNCNMFNPVAGSFLIEDSIAVDAILSKYVKDFNIIKGNSFFPPADSSTSYILFTYMSEEDSLVSVDILNDLTLYLNNKYLINIHYQPCIMISPGRCFFMPSSLPEKIRNIPIFLLANCRDILREKREHWDKHRIEWDENIFWLTSYNSNSIATSISEETIPQSTNTIISPLIFEETLSEIIPSRHGYGRYIVFVIGQDLMEKLGY